MSAETQLYDALRALPDVVAVVSDRIRPVVLHEGDDLPAIAYKRESTEYTNTIGNAAVANKVTFDIMCLAGNFAEAETLGDAVVDLSFEKVDRRSEYDPETKTFAAVVTVAIWP